MAVDINIQNALRKAGVWQQFYRRRDALKKEGLKPSAAQQQALLEVGYKQQGDGQAIIEPPFEVLQEHANPPAKKPKASKPSPPKRDELEDPAQMFDEQIDEAVARVVKGKRGSTLQSVQWVAANIAVAKGYKHKPEQLLELATEAPSGEAFPLLVWVIAQRSNESEFWKSIWAKTLPTRQQIDAEAKFTDDGRDMFRIIDSIRRRHSSSQN